MKWWIIISEVILIFLLGFVVLPNIYPWRAEMYVKKAREALLADEFCDAYQHYESARQLGKDELASRCIFLKMIGADDVYLDNPNPIQEKDLTFVFLSSQAISRFPKDEQEALYRAVPEGFLERHLKCTSVQRNPKLRLAILEWFANQGHAMAQYEVAYEYYTGESVCCDIDYLRRMCKAAVEQGYIPACLLLGEIESNAGNLNAEFQLFKRAADVGDLEAQKRVATMYKLGHGVDKSEDLKIHYLTLAAEQGDVSAQHTLGACYLKEDGVAASPEKAFPWLKMAADAGDVEAQGVVASMYKLGTGVEQSSEMAVHYLRLSAEKDDKESQYLLGRSYLEGDGIESSSEEAEKWLRLAATSGHVDAQLSLGLFYNHKGQYIESFDWFLKAAEAGNARAQCIVGHAYYTGVGVSQSNQKAFAWFNISAEQGNADGQLALGRMYRWGIGTELSFESARYWFRKSAEQGNEEAKEALEELE